MDDDDFAFSGAGLAVASFTRRSVTIPAAPRVAAPAPVGDDSGRDTPAPAAHAHARGDATGAGGGAPPPPRERVAPRGADDVMPPPTARPCAPARCAVMYSAAYVASLARLRVHEGRDVLLVTLAHACAMFTYARVVAPRLADEDELAGFHDRA